MCILGGVHSEYYIFTDIFTNIFGRNLFYAVGNCEYGAKFKSLI